MRRRLRLHLDEELADRDKETRSARYSRLEIVMEIGEGLENENYRRGVVESLHYNPQARQVIREALHKTPSEEYSREPKRTATVYEFCDFFQRFAGRRYTVRLSNFARVAAPRDWKAITCALSKGQD